MFLEFNFTFFGVYLVCLRQLLDINTHFNLLLSILQGVDDLELLLEVHPAALSPRIPLLLRADPLPHLLRRHVQVQAAVLRHGVRARGRPGVQRVQI